MEFKITKKSFKNKTTKSFIIDFIMKDFCCVKDDLFFIHDRGIGLISGEVSNLNWNHELAYIKKPDFSKFSSICYNELDNSLYFVSNSGSQIYKANLSLMDFENLISESSAEIFKKQFLGTNNSETHIVSNGKKVVWSVKDSHRCFALNSDNAIPLVGCGKPGFSISNLKNTKISKPTGITIMGDVVCFADSGNNCLRGVSGSSTFNIVSDCKDVVDIHYVNKKLFFLSDNVIHMLSSEGDATHLFEVYKVKNRILSFCPTNKSDIYILEENNVSSTETKVNKST